MFIRILRRASEKIEFVFCFFLCALETGWEPYISGRVIDCSARCKAAIKRGKKSKNRKAYIPKNIID